MIILGQVEFYVTICLEAECIIKRTGKLEGAHYAAMRLVLERDGLLDQAERYLDAMRSKKQEMQP